MTSLGTIVVIMLVTGAVGGFTNYLLSTTAGTAPGKPANDKASDAAPQLRWWGFVIVGIVATFLVPLFLSLAQSDLFQTLPTDVGSSLNKLFVFVGFCLIASISSRAFIETISQRVLALAQQAAKTSKENEKRLARQRDEFDELAAIVGNQLDAGQPPGARAAQFAPAADEALPALTDKERDVLNALQTRAYRRRTLKGVATDTSLGLTEARELLGALIAKGLAVDVKGQQSGDLFYEITARGAYVLGKSA